MLTHLMILKHHSALKTQSIYSRGLIEVCIFFFKRSFYGETSLQKNGVKFYYRSIYYVLLYVSGQVKHLNIYSGCTVYQTLFKLWYGSINRRQTPSHPLIVLGTNGNIFHSCYLEHGVTVSGEGGVVLPHNVC